MAEEVTADELFKNVSRQLGVPEADLREFARQHQIDPVELYKEKVAAMEWKAKHAGRMVLVGRTAFTEVLVEHRKEIGKP